MVPWAHPSPHPKRHTDWFSRFTGLTTATDQRTNRHTDTPRSPHYSLFNSRPHLHSSEAQPNNKLCNIAVKDGTNQSHNISEIYNVRLCHTRKGFERSSYRMEANGLILYALQGRQRSYRQPRYRDPRPFPREACPMVDEHRMRPDHWLRSSELPSVLRHRCWVTVRTCGPQNTCAKNPSS